MALRGLLLALLATAFMPSWAAELKAPQRLTLKGAEYARDGAARSPNGTWRYVRDANDETGPWTTEIVLSLAPGAGATPQTEADRLSAGKLPQSPGKLLGAEAEAQHAYWRYVVEPPAGEKSSYLGGAGKSFHVPGCQGVVRYEFRARYPMAWVPNDQQREALREALDRDTQRFVDALKDDRWTPSCK